MPPAAGATGFQGSGSSPLPQRLAYAVVSTAWYTLKAPPRTSPCLLLRAPPGSLGVPSPASACVASCSRRRTPPCSPPVRSRAPPAHAPYRFVCRPPHTTMLMVFLLLTKTHLSRSHPSVHPGALASASTLPRFLREKGLPRVNFYTSPARGRGHTLARLLVHSPRALLLAASSTPCSGPSTSPCSRSCTCICANLRTLSCSRPCTLSVPASAHNIVRTCVQTFAHDAARDMFSGEALEDQGREEMGASPLPSCVVSSFSLWCRRVADFCLRPSLEPYLLTSTGDHQALWKTKPERRPRVSGFCTVVCVLEVTPVLAMGALRGAAHRSATVQHPARVRARGCARAPP